MKPPTKSHEQLRAALEAMQAFYRRATVAVPLNMPQIKGIFLGGCVCRGVGSSFRAQAHAHNDRRDDNFGWVCFRSLRRLGQVVLVECDDGTTEVQVMKPSKILIHEWAHVLTPGHGHDDCWRAKMRELGQRIPKNCQKKMRLR